MKKTFTLLAFTILCRLAVAQSFTPIASFGGGARALSSSFSIPSLGKGYVVGGSEKQDVWSYDVTTNSWSQEAPFPGIPDGQVAFNINDTGYVATGVTLNFVWSNALYKYNPIANTWTQKANFPGVPRGYAFGFAANGKGYVGGGTHANNNGGSYDFYEYDPTVDKWTRRKNCPAMGCDHCASAFAINDKGYVGGGEYIDTVGGTYTTQSDFWEYDPATDNWIRKADLGGGTRSGGVSFASCDRGYISCGRADGAQTITLHDCWEYKPVTDSWAKAADIGAQDLYAPSAFTIGSVIYVGNGGVRAGNLDLWYKYKAIHTPGFSAGSSVCANNPVNFTDTSNYTPTNWQWSFPGATPNTSSRQNPTVQYSATGAYDVILTAWNGCDTGTQTFTKYITVGQGGVLTATANPPLVCSGQTAVLSITAGSGTYSWAPAAGLADSTSSSISVNPSSTTTYTVTSAGGGNCPSTGQVVVTVGNTANGGTITTLRDTICSGTPGLIALSGNSKDTLHWQSSENGTDFSDVANQTAADTIQYRTIPLTASAYFRVLEANGNCSSTSNTLQLIVPPTLTASFVYTLTGQTALFNADSSKGNISSYFWDFGDGLTANIANPTHTYTADTTVSACLTIYDGSNCSYTFCRTVVWSGVKEISAAGNWNIYPSPFTDELTIESKLANTTVENTNMYNMLGQLVVSEANTHTANSAFHLNTASLTKGMYFLQLKTSAGSFVQKVIKE